MDTIHFLKEKGMLKLGNTDFIIKGDSYEINLNDLLEEYHHMKEVGHPKRHMPNVSIEQIKEIIQLSKLTKKQLRKKNPEGAYSGSDLTRHQLIYQIAFRLDSPDEL